MEVSTKELRVQPGKILEQVAQGVEVTVTFRGKALARIVPFSAGPSPKGETDDGVFGMWSNRSDEISVDSTVRKLREGRKF